MDDAARDALSAIRRCLALERYRAGRHFIQRMDKRGLFWPDVLSVADSPAAVLDKGLDEFDRPKWLLVGNCTDGSPLSIVCALDTDAGGALTVFITIYWEEA